MRKRLLLVCFSLLLLILSVSCVDQVVPFDNIPTIYINTENNVPVKDKKTWIRGVYKTDSTEELSMQIKGRGNTNWGLAKKPYTIKFGEKVSMFGMKEAKKWVLIANHGDLTMLRNWFAFYLGNNIFDSEWCPSSAFVHLYLNDKYVGLYLLTDKVEIDDNRVDIKKIKETRLNGGFLLETNRRADEINNFITDNDVAFSLSDPDDPESVCVDKVKAYIQEVEDYLYDSSFKDEKEIKYFDLESVVDWYLINEITANSDSVFYASVYMYYNPDDEKLHFGPLWDFDMSCGNMNHTNAKYPTGFYIKEENPWMREFFKNEVFVSLVQKRWNECYSELSKFDSIIQNEANFLSQAVISNFKRWPILGTKVWDYSPDGYKNRTTYQDEVDFMIDWLDTRIQWLDSAFDELNSGH